VWTKNIFMKNFDNLSPEELGHLFPIVLQPYDKKWKSAFIVERKQLLSILGAGVALKVKHIGSTAIDSISSKPTIDILIEIPEKCNMSNEIIGLMKKNGYYYILRHDLETLPYMSFVKGYDAENTNQLTFHIYLAPRNHSIWNRVAFRDYLINHPETAKDYEKLKIKLVAKYKFDREKYTEGKATFVKKITKLVKDAVK
jgi:GrpB-like predicted nucleotidyltransferase (UPF0157 family)